MSHELKFDKGNHNCRKKRAVTGRR